MSVVRSFEAGLAYLEERIGRIVEQVKRPVWRASSVCFEWSPEGRHLAARRRTRRVARQPALAGFQELLRPAVIKTLGNTLPAAQLGNALLAPQAVQHNPDLLFG